MTESVFTAPDRSVWGGPPRPQCQRLCFFTAFYTDRRPDRDETAPDRRNTVLCEGNGRGPGRVGPQTASPKYFFNFYFDPHALSGPRGHHSRTKRAVGPRTAPTAAEGRSFWGASNASYFTCSRGPPGARKTRHKTRVCVERLQSGFRSRKRDSLCSLLASVPT